MDQPYRPHGGEPDPRPYSPSDPARGYAAQDGAAAGGGAAGTGPWAGGGDAAPSPWARGADPDPSYPQPGSSYPESGPSYSQSGPSYSQPGSSYPESGPSYAQPGPYEPGYQPGYQPAGTDPGYQPTSPGYPQYQPAGTDQGYPSYQPAGADPAFSSMAPGTPVMLGGPITPERPKRRRRGVLVAAGTAVALLIGGVAYAGISLWSSPGGTEPEDVMPGGVAAFGRLDLDPALGQQKKIADLLGKFPNRGGSAEERVAQLKKDLINGLELPGLKADDITPWLGDRFGVGLWNRDDKLYGLIALACKDENKAKAAVAKARQSGDGTKPGVAFLDGYAVLALPAEDSGDGQAAADAAVTATKAEKLSSHKAYADLVGKLPSNEVALVYADTAFLIDSMTRGKRSKGEPDFKALLGDNAGQFVAGAQATDDGIEIRLRTSAQSAPAPTGDAGKAADALPGNSIIAAAAVVSDTPALADQLDKSVGSLRELFGASADKFTDGFKALLGSTLTLAVTDLAGKEPSARFSANTTSADKAKKLSDALTAVFGRTLKPDRQGNRVDVTLGSYKPAGTLGATDLYKRALAGRPDKSVFVGYLDVQRLVPSLGLSASDRADIAPVKAVGVAVGVDGNAGTALIRVIIG